MPDVDQRSTLNMLYEVRDLVLSDDVGAGSAHKAVLLSILLYRERSGLIRPSIDQIARGAGVHRATVLRVLPELEAAGLIRRRHRGGRRPSEFEVFTTGARDATGERSRLHGAPAAEDARDESQLHGARDAVACGRRSGRTVRPSEDLSEDLSEDQRDTRAVSLASATMMPLGWLEEASKARPDLAHEQIAKSWKKFAAAKSARPYASWHAVHVFWLDWLERERPLEVPSAKPRSEPAAPYFAPAILARPNEEPESPSSTVRVHKVRLPSPDELAASERLAMGDWSK